MSFDKAYDLELFACGSINKLKRKSVLVNADVSWGKYYCDGVESGGRNFQ